MTQNLAEAEYIIAVYMYMRLLGYPAVIVSPCIARATMLPARTNWLT